MNTENRKEVNKRLIAEIDPSLDKYKEVVLFPELLAKANETLQKTGLPKVKNEVQ